jgi:hypothetical protein
MNKKFILETFNTHFKEFLEDVLLLFPREVDLMTANTFLSSIVKVKRKLLLECWYFWVYTKYNNEIENDNYDFFLNKNYQNDVGRNNKILNSIEKMRNKCKNINNENRSKILLYVKNLSKLSKIYYTN